MFINRWQTKNWGWFILSQAVHTVITLGILGALFLVAKQAGALDGVLSPAAQTGGTSFTTINYQGRLADAAGHPISDTVTLQFAIYDAATGGNLLWTETHANVPVSEGLFSVRLGSQTSGGLPLDVFSNGDVWLETTVEGETLSPREKLAAVPFAMQASEAEHTVVAERAYTLSAPDGEPEEAVSVDDEGRVGIGTSAPYGATQVEIKRGWGDWIGLRAAQDNGLWHIHNPLQGNRIEIGYMDSAGNESWGYFVLTTDGKVGIGATQPAANLHVAGDFIATGTKSAVVETEHYGQRKLYAFEQASNRFGDEGKATLVGGVARVDLDPVFLETIEGEFLIHVTPYGPASLYVAEIGEDYFIVRSQDGDPDVSFAWQLTAFRKGYADARLEAVDGE